MRHILKNAVVCEKRFLLYLLRVTPCDRVITSSLHHHLACFPCFLYPRRRRRRRRRRRILHHRRRRRRRRLLHHRRRRILRGLGPRLPGSLASTTGPKVP